jgi:hypothetical protein
MNTTTRYYLDKDDNSCTIWDTQTRNSSGNLVAVKTFAYSKGAGKAIEDAREFMKTIEAKKEK